MVTTVGKILLRRLVPADLRDYVDGAVLDKKGTSQLCQLIAEKHPEKYGETVAALTRLGFEISARQGASLTLNDLLCPIDKDAYFKEAAKKISDIKDQKLRKEHEDERITRVYTDMSKQMEKDSVSEGVKQGKTLAKVVLAGTRGSPTQYLQTVVSPVIVADASGKAKIDFPIHRSFAEGLTLPEYLMSTFGARQGVVSTKMATADSGFLSKQISRAAMTLGITEHDCGTRRGLTVGTNEKDYIGSFLAQPVDKYHYNNEVTSAVLHDLANRGIKEMIVRTPMTCEASGHSHPGAICQLCAGIRENGLPKIGEYIGITSGTTLGEPLSQGMLSTKHTGGAAGKSHIGGFKLVNQLFNIPENFVEKAPVATHDGLVKEIKEAPGGGYFIRVEDIS